jgi:flagellin-like protein
MRRITKLKRSVRAISPVIATLLMIAIAVVASLIVYAWVIGYIGSGTTKASNSMLIQSTSHTTDNFVVVYVQNVGQGTLELKQAESVYVNSILMGITSSTPALSAGKVTFSPETTATLTTDYHYTANEKLKIKITATDGTFAEYTTTGISGISTGTFPAWPKASFTMSTSYPDVGQSVTFTDTSVKGAGTINQWSWNFGDGATSPAQNPSHSYSTTGSKTVTLTVTDTNSRTATTTHTLLVSTYASPVASFTWTPSTPGVNVGVLFNSDSSSAGSGTITQWSWTFDSSHGASRGSSSSQNPSAVSYSSAGQKSVTLTVTNSNGKTSTTTRTVNIAFDAPTAEFTLSAPNPDVDQTVTFTDASTAASTGTINQWSWNFGDSTTSATQNPTHSYTTPGAKTITLTVTDSNAKTSTAKHTLTVNDYTPPTASFTFAPTVPTINQPVAFTDTSTAGSGTITQWSWSFGTGGSPATSSSQNPSASYSTVGQKTISLTVTNSNGKTGTITQTLQVDAATQPPTVVFLSGFDGTPWDQGWSAGNNPPFYRAPGEGVSGVTTDAAAKSDPYTTYVPNRGNVPNYGPFTSNEVNTSGGNIIYITFSYKVHQTDAPEDLKLAYSTKHNPILDSDNLIDFNYFAGGNIGTAIPADTWTTKTIIIAKTQMAGAIVDSTAFTQSFSFRFHSDLHYGAGGIVEQVWVDNVEISVGQ